MPPKAQAKNLAKKTATASPSTSAVKKISKSKAMQVDHDLLPKIKPKGKCGAYIHFTTDKLNNLTKELEAMGHLDRMKALGPIWKELPEKQRLKYTKLADDDKVRFERETKEFADNGFYVNTDGVKSTDLKVELKNFPKETVLPKKSLSAYFHFSVETAKEIRLANPSIKIGEVGSQVKAKWDGLSDAKKKPYEKLADDDKARMEKERDQLCTYGYFIDKDGVRSTELTRKIGKRERQENAEKAKLEKEKESLKKES